MNSCQQQTSWLEKLTKEAFQPAKFVTVLLYISPNYKWIPENAKFIVNFSEVQLAWSMIPACQLINKLHGAFRVDIFKGKTLFVVFVLISCQNIHHFRKSQEPWRLPNTSYDILNKWFKYLLHQITKQISRLNLSIITRVTWSCE